MPDLPRQCDREGEGSVRVHWHEAEPPEGDIVLWRGHRSDPKAWTRSYVPAEQHRGAVEALGALAYMTRTFMEQADYAVSEATETELVEVLDDVDRIVGGGSQ